MPDGDYYRRSPHQVWRSAHRMVLAGASPEELASPARLALAHTLRHGHGLPGLAEAADIVSAIGAGQKDVRRGLEDLRSLERAVGRGSNAALGVEGARRVLAEVAFGGSVPIDAAYVVAERACWALLEHHFLDLAPLNFLGIHFTNLSEVREWESACRAEFAQDVRRICGGRRASADGREATSTCPSTSTPSHCGPPASTCAGG